MLKSLMAFFLIASAASSAEKQNFVPSTQKLQELIQQLGDPRYKERESASNQLLAFDGLAIVQLKQGMKSDDFEIRSRSGMILEQITKNHMVGWAEYQSAILRFVKESQGVHSLVSLMNEIQRVNEPHQMEVSKHLNDYSIAEARILELSRSYEKDGENIIDVLMAIDKLRTENRERNVMVEEIYENVLRSLGFSRRKNQNKLFYKEEFEIQFYCEDMRIYLEVPLSASDRNGSWDIRFAVKDLFKTSIEFGNGYKLERALPNGVSLAQHDLTMHLFPLLELDLMRSKNYRLGTSYGILTSESLGEELHLSSRNMVDLINWKALELDFFSPELRYETFKDFGLDESSIDQFLSIPAAKY